MLKTNYNMGYGAMGSIPPPNCHRHHGIRSHIEATNLLFDGAFELGHSIYPNPRNPMVVIWLLVPLPRKLAMYIRFLFDYFYKTLSLSRYQRKNFEGNLYDLPDNAIYKVSSKVLSSF